MTNITKAAQDALEALEALMEGSMRGLSGRPETWGLIRMPTNSAMNKGEAALNALRAALQDKAGEAHIPAAGPSTYEQRFSEAVRLLTHASPPAGMVSAWLDHASEDLQHWIGLQKGTPEWAQCLAITDAAHAMAISPIEGEQHTFEPLAAQPTPVVPDGFAQVIAGQDGGIETKD